MVHRRQVEDETLIFGVHGALWGNAMTWWDHGTGSVWSQPLGEAILGPRKGQKLDLVSSQFTTWEAWRSAHPSTLALDVPAGPSSFDLADFLLVIDFDEEARGYAVPDLRDVGVINDTVAGVDVALVSDPHDPQRWSVFSRLLETGTVELQIEGAVVRDTFSGTTFDPISGVGLDGPLSDQTLGQLPAFTSFPGDFDTFWPDAQIWTP